MPFIQSRTNRQRGAVLVHVAIALVGLLAFSALVVDYGILWVARRQVQNSADAGALAGAISLAYGPPVANREDLGDPAYAAARAAAAAVGRSNIVWGTAPRISLTEDDNDVRIIECPDPGLPDKCVRVDAYRNQEGGAGNAPLPTFFARLVGVDTQGVRATATAEIVSGNIVPHCLKPFALSDRWMDGPPDDALTPSVLGDTFNPPPLAADVYDPERIRWEFPRDYGTTVVLHTDSHARPTSSWAQLTALAGKGTSDIREAITGCVDVSLKISPDFPDSIELKNGGSEGLKHGIADLVAAYPNTVWDHRPTSGHPNGQLVCGDPSGCDNYRIGAIPIYRPTDVTHPQKEMPIVDFVGIYIEGMGDDPAVEAAHPEFVALVPKNSERKKYVVGHIVPAKGIRSGTAGAPRDSSFLRTVVLVR